MAISLLTNSANTIVGEVGSLVNPVWDSLTYFIPKTGCLWGAAKIRGKFDITQEHVIPHAKRQQVLDKIDQLRVSADIKKKVMVYGSTKMDRIYASYGGRFSFTKPVIELPMFDLFRTQGFGNFGSEKQSEQLKKDIWRFSDHETSFLIMRELVKIRNNDRWLKLTAKVMMMSAILLFHFGPAGWIPSVAIFGIALPLYFAIDRYYESRLDRAAVKYLTKNLRDERQAVKAAISVISKMQQQNLTTRGDSFIAKILTNSKGDFRFENRPSFTKRIKQLNLHLDKIAEREANAPILSRLFRPPSSELDREDL